MGEDAKTTESTAQQPEGRVVTKYNYSKSPHFRTVFADGVYGGPGAKPGTVQIGVFTERFPFPTQTVDVDGEEDVKLRKGIEGFEREIEVSLVMKTETAKSFVAWLEERIKMAESLQTKK